MAVTVAATNQEVKVGTGRIEIVRVIRASRQRVFDAWTRPEMIRQWFGAGTMKVVELDADAQVDGGYSITAVGSPAPGVEEKTSKVSGRYTRVEPYDVLAFTWNANFAPGEESLVTLSFRDVAGGTEMTLLQEGFTQESTRDSHIHGWTSALDKLQRLVEG